MRSYENTRQELIRVVRRVRLRWRLKLALRGAAVVLAGAGVVFLVSAFGLERFAFRAESVLAFRVALYGSLSGLVLWFMIRPLSRRVRDEQVALYLEEHEPTLEASIISALELDRPAESGLSPTLARKLVETAIERVRAVEDGRHIEQRSVRRSWATILGVGLAAAILLFLGPGYLRHGASALFFPLRSAEAANPYSIAVFPGDTTLARGADQRVAATLSGFVAEEAELFTRSGGGAFEAIPMVAAEDSGTFEILLFDLDDATEYYVEADGVRSPVHRIAVADLPSVGRLELEYHYPRYTGLPPRVVEDGGDIAVLPGTEVVVRAIPTLLTPGGAIVMDDEATQAMEPAAEGALTGSFSVTAQGFYHIELEGPDGTLVTATPRYAIDVLDDLPPTVTIVKPQRDTRATSIEEVYIEARADDDYGIGRLDLVLAVNGGEEETLELFRGGSGPRTDVTAGHTLFLEELGLVPGDVIAYYARAVDDNRIGGRKTVLSDIYFLQIRPFGMDFRQADAAGAPGGAGGGAAEGALSERQREIIAATFNVIRDRDTYSADDYAEHVVTLALAQGRLREQVERLVDQLRTRAVTADSSFLRIADLLPKAADAMQEAQALLDAQEAQEALPPEQRALQHLLTAEAVYREVQISLSQQQGGGGGGGGAAEDLADLFELELDKLANQYETVQRGQQEQTDTQLDETMERLKELARRQQQELERQRRAAASQRGGGGGGRQRELAEETEEAARQLERLARENGSPEMQETARRLREAAEAMRQSASRSGQNEGAAAADEALRRLDEARRLLDRQRTNRLQQAAEDALRRVEELAADQQEVLDELESLPDPGQRRPADEQRLMQRKDLMAAEVEALERQLDRLAADARRENPEAGRELQDAANAIRDDKLKEKLRFSKAVLQGRSSEFARTFDEQIASDLERLRQQLEEAVQATGQMAQGDRTEEALERARDLVRGIESLDERMREAVEETADRRPPTAEGSRGEQDPSGQGQPPGEAESQQGQPAGGQQPSEREQGSQGDRPGGQQDSPGQQSDRAGGRFSPQGGGGDSRPGEFSREQARQFGRELGQRRADAEALERALSDQGLDASELADIIDAMRQLERERTYNDPAEVERLRMAIVEGLKSFEFRLRRELAADETDRLFLSGNDDVPEGFRELVEEYYRQLARQRQPQP